MGASGGRLYELLLSHGVPERAGRIYLAACREGPQTAAELARISGVHRVEAYRHIKQLEVSGLLRATGHRPMRFAALPPEALLDRWIRGATERLRHLEADKERTLEELESGLVDTHPEDTRKFTVIEGQAEIYRFLVRRIGTAKKEIFAAMPGAALPMAINGGIDRALRNANERGVKVRIVTEIHLANRTEAQHFAAFAGVRHSPHPVVSRSIVIDHAGAAAYISGPEGIGGTTDAQVALWSNAPSFRTLATDYLQKSWTHAIPAERRLVELETTTGATLPVRPGEREPFLRLQEIAALGMRASGISELQMSLAEIIEAIGSQLGRQVSEELSGETPEEVARSLAEYYRHQPVGRLEVTKSRPLTLKVTQCFACVQQSPEIGRRLCPMLLKSAFEHRIGTPFDVSQPDPSRHATRGCLFTVTPA